MALFPLPSVLPCVHIYITGTTSAGTELCCYSEEEPLQPVEKPRCPIWAGWVTITLLTDEMKGSVGKMASSFFKKFP